jgi:WD40 repeat protein
MASLRAGHTATLLLDGSVLVAGAGQLDIDDLLVSFPFSETLTSSGQVMTTGNLSTPREFHTATLLQNGKVLITGGNVFRGYPTGLPSSASAELYDPSVGQSVAIGDMSVARTGHTASLLADGRVLIFGGTASGTPSAEIYDPSGGTFAPVPNPLFSRSGHTATVLPSGKVLFTGGQDSSGTLATAEMYDPATNMFAAVGSMTEPRTHHTATLLPNGKVLVAGGGVTSSVLGAGVPLDVSPQLMVDSPSNTAELFDPQTGTFASAGTMNTGRSSHTATLLPDGTVLLCGGSVGWFITNGYVSDNTAEIYDPATGSFKEAGTMNTGKFWQTATLLPSGTVVLLGGIDRDLPLNVVETFK